MRLMFKDLGNSLSTRTCFSRFLTSSAVILLVFLLSAVFIFGEHKGDGSRMETASYKHINGQ